jgi:uncharacterized protein YjbJ (UPF0337 family)
MRSISIAILVAGAMAILPLATSAQTNTPSTQTPTTMSQEDLHTMWEKIKGAWTQTKGAVKERWGKLTDDDLLEIQGRREKLVGKIQTRYGISHEEAEAQVGGWEQKYHSM